MKKQVYMLLLFSVFAILGAVSPSHVFSATTLSQYDQSNTSGITSYSCTQSFWSPEIAQINSSSGYATSSLLVRTNFKASAGLSNPVVGLYYSAANTCTTTVTTNGSSATPSCVGTGINLWASHTLTSGEITTFSDGNFHTLDISSWVQSVALPTTTSSLYLKWANLGYSSSPSCRNADLGSTIARNSSGIPYYEISKDGSFSTGITSTQYSSSINSTQILSLQTLATTTTAREKFVCDNIYPSIGSCSLLSSSVFSATTSLESNLGIPASFSSVFGTPVNNKYYVVMPLNPGGGCSNYTTECAPGGTKDNVGYYQFQYSSSTGWSNTFVTPPPDNSTRLISIFPENATTTATTSVTFSVSGYVASSDWDNKMSVSIDAGNRTWTTNNATSPLLAVDQINDTNNIKYSWSIATSGPFSFSTSTPITKIGWYDMTTKISSPSFSVFGYNFFTDTKISSTTSFLVSTTSPYDNILTGQGNIVDIVQNGTTGGVDKTCDDLVSSTTASTTAITLKDLPFRTMVYCFFVPTSGITNAAGTAIWNDIVLRAPFGYLTRLYQIGLSNATTSLPVLHYVFPSFMPVVGGYHWDIDPWTPLMSSSTNPFYWQDLDYGDTSLTGKSIWEIMGPIYNVLVECLFVIASGALVWYRYKK